MKRAVLDSSCLIAAVCAWHEHHEATALGLETRHAAGQRFVMAAPAVIEAYSVLTRLPPPHRLSPADALQLLDRNWGAREAVALTPEEYWQLLRAESARSVSGGRIYDALIARCARKARAQDLLTWNVDHFAPFAGEDLRIHRPGD